MRFYPSILGLILVLLVLGPLTPAIADGGVDVDEAIQGEEAATEYGPWECCWYNQPWEYWRHTDWYTLDADAIHYMAGVRTIAILPFVDMTSPTNQGESVLESSGGPRRILDNLAAELMLRGYLIIPPPDAEALLTEMLGLGGPYYDAVANNLFFRDHLAERTTSFHLEVVSGLERHYGIDKTYYIPGELIQEIASELGADAVIRGYVNEYAVSRDIDADWRTFLPPFLGLINPDRRVTMQVAYYLYNGETGDLVWNGTTESRDDAAWPLFESQSELLYDVESEVVWEMTDRILPSWEHLCGSHPDWLPMGMWADHGPGHDKWVYRPDWLNPYRHGWHDEYERASIRWNTHTWVGDDSPAEPEVIEHHYDGVTDRHHRGR